MATRRPGHGGGWAGKTVKRPPQQPPQPQCANYWAPLMQKRHQKDHRPQRPSARIDPTQRREERVIVQDPVKKPRPDGMSHRGLSWVSWDFAPPPPPNKIRQIFPGGKMKFIEGAGQWRPIEGTQSVLWLQTPPSSHKIRQYRAPPPGGKVRRRQRYQCTCTVPVHAPRCLAVLDLSSVRRMCIGC